MTVLQGALRAQLGWFAAASLYNSLSLVAMAQGQQGYAGDAATTKSAMFAVLFFGATTVAGISGRTLTYRILAPIALILLLVGGVIKHFLLGPADYASFVSWVIAIAINTFGVVAFGIGVVASYRSD